MVYRAVADDGAPLAVKVSVYPGDAGEWLREERARVIALMGTDAAPWLVPVLASGEWSGRPFLVMPWMPLTLEAQEETVLFSFSDRPGQEAMGLWREKRG